MSFLDERFAEIDRQLAEVLRASRAHVSHHGGRGDEVAAALGEMVSTHLVECASFHERCQVQDVAGSASGQLDLVFLNRFHPAFLAEGRPPAFYIEGIIAAAEVKTSLNKTEVIGCLEKARAFKRLVARVDGRDLQAHNVDAGDWQRFLLRRPFFAFAYEDTRDLGTVQDNIDEWVSDNSVPYTEQIDAVFVLNKGVLVNLGAGIGVIELKDAAGDILNGFVRKAVQPVSLQLMLWLSLVCPSFWSLHPILLRYELFSADGYVR